MKKYTAVQGVRTQSIKEICSSDMKEQIPFQIQNITEVMKNEYDESAPSIYCRYFTVLWVRKGAGDCVIDLDKMEVKNSTIYFAKPGQILHLDMTENTEGYAIRFAKCFLYVYEDQGDTLSSSGLFDLFSGAAMIPVDCQANAEMHSLAERMMGEFNRSNLCRDEILRGLLKIFLLYITRQHAQGNRQYHKPGNTELVKKFFALVERKYISCRTVSEYARELAVTSNYLNEVIKKITGVSASGHIQQRVILEAKRNAAYARISMKEVAYKLGFDDTYHFSKYFKNASGVNFTDFKKEISQQLEYA